MNNTLRLLTVPFILPMFSFLWASSSPIDGSTVAREANSLIGRPYIYGGNNPAKGIDCSALLKYIFKKHGYILPRRAAWQMRNTKACPTYYKLSEARIGDALYFKSRKTGKIHHVAVVTGFSKDGVPIITHAKGKKFGVVREKMGERYRMEFAGIKRFQFCSSPLAGYYSNEEVAHAVIREAEEQGIVPDIYGRTIAYIGNLDPLTIMVAGDTSPALKLSEELSRAGIPSKVRSDGIVAIHPRNISEAGNIVEGLEEYSIPYLAGLSLVPSQYISKKHGKPHSDSEDNGKFIFYPYPNLQWSSKIVAECIRENNNDPVAAASCYKKWAFGLLYSESEQGAPGPQAKSPKNL